MRYRIPFYILLCLAIIFLTVAVLPFFDLPDTSAILMICLAIIHMAAAFLLVVICLTLFRKL
ncbi:hypothetical protein KTO58_27430 [Chitinophaga pendula]|uniref:hypothetical protein n=1 Tax=Chitinophaga TaxID=79328 RepID=UPI000BB0B16A|nr:MULTISPECIES: hypothetical protein [Chitinophaga]ASZ09709.1 hypothetical protein CK934_01325 [Chitinophaga sp. MD30]UCJ07349.1 hypothetical protein KTO58_27430 [Chitinophaga pendula]